MLEKNNLGDLSIVPAVISKIRTRSECFTNYSTGQSPFIVAPMDTVIDEKNFFYFLASGLNVCLPRGVKYPKGFINNSPNLVFTSMSLEEFSKTICKEPQVGDNPIENFNILVDIANGHMSELIDLCFLAKRIWGDKLTLMVGNIANPETIRVLAEYGVDYVRVGIGGGSVCTTTTHTGVHYPMASLIQECAKIADELNSDIKIVADGGIRSTADINIALACGADYVMMGGLFNQCIESCAKTYWMGIKIPKLLSLYLYDWGFKLYKDYRGMSTVEVQKKWGRQNLKLSEGLKKRNKVKYELTELLSHINHRLKTAMSYTNCNFIEEFNSGTVNLIKKTQDTSNRVNK